MSSRATLALALSLAAANAKPATPHIVFMLADDLGYGIPGWGGNPTQITPALDALRADGLTLTDNHVYQFCSPSKPGVRLDISSRITLPPLQLEEPYSPVVIPGSCLR